MQEIISSIQFLKSSRISKDQCSSYNLTSFENPACTICWDNYVCFAVKKTCAPKLLPMPSPQQETHTTTNTALTVLMQLKYGHPKKMENK